VTSHALFASTISHRSRGAALLGLPIVATNPQTQRIVLPMVDSLRGPLRIGFYAAAIAVATLSLMPRATEPPVSIGDKAEHLLAYVGLGLLGAATARSRAGVLSTILGLVAFGAGLELLQVFSPGRSPELADALVNLAGAILGSSAITMLRRLRAAHLALTGERD
jgi:VanZ family protein